MMEQSQRAQTIALAAICQAAVMIQQIAKGKTCNAASVECLLKGVMATNPSTVFDVYHSLTDLAEGNRVMVQQLSGNSTTKDVEVTRYVAGIMSLSKKLLKNNRALAKLKAGLEDIERRLVHFDLTSTSILQNFADNYSEAISPIGQKIQVIGNPDVLRQPAIQAKVRALLLAGIRAAILWRQMGGKRRQFLFNRNQILQDAIMFNKELTSIS